MSKKKKDEQRIEKRSIKHAEDSDLNMVVGRIRKIEKKTKRKNGENKDGGNGGSESD